MYESYYFGVIGPGFLNQVPTLPKSFKLEPLGFLRCWCGSANVADEALSIRSSKSRVHGLYRSIWACAVEVYFFSGVLEFTAKPGF